MVANDSMGVVLIRTHASPALFHCPVAIAVTRYGHGVYITELHCLFLAPPRQTVQRTEETPNNYFRPLTPVCALQYLNYATSTKTTHRNTARVYCRGD